MKTPQKVSHNTPLSVLGELRSNTIAVKKNKRKKRGARTTLSEDAQNVLQKEQTTSREPDTPIGIFNYVCH